jgi:hypothetical protein
MPTITGTPTVTDTRGARPDRVLAAERFKAPVGTANSARNARAELGRHRRWGPARDALWHVLEPLVNGDARVAIVGAGNGDTLPLSRIVARAREVTLIDIDAHAIRAARRRQPRGLRRRIEVIGHDVTNGAADAIATAAATADVPVAEALCEAPVPGAPYDLVIGDLFYSQLLYPALVDLDIPAPRRTAFIARYAPTLTRSVVARLHRSADHGRVLHIHDPIAWWPGHPQPVSLDQILATASRDPEAALALAARGNGPHHSDPRPALDAFAIPIQATTLWHWPFASGIDYLACATLTGRPAEG